jgi:hypothetical protein
MPKRSDSRGWTFTVCLALTASAVAGQGEPEKAVVSHHVVGGRRHGFRVRLRAPEGLKPSVSGFVRWDVQVPLRSED